MVPLGLHWPINAVMLLNIKTLGYDFIQGPMGAWNFACFGATAGVLVLSLRHRDIQMRQTSTGALAAGLLGGISEPSLYGIHLRFKRIYPRMLVGCFVGGLIIGVGSLVMGLPNGVTTQAFVFTSLLTIPAFNPIGALRDRDRRRVLHGDVPRDRCPTSARPSSRRSSRRFAMPPRLRRRRAHVAPATVEAADAAAIDASDAAPAAAAATADRRCSSASRSRSPRRSRAGSCRSRRYPTPCSRAASWVRAPRSSRPATRSTRRDPGMVAAAQPTGHAFGLVLDGGVEVLIHVGIDTVNLKGEGFDVKVKNGDRVELGTPLVTFDREVIEDAGYPLVTPVIVLNGKKFASVQPMATGEVTAGAPILAVATKAEPANV